MSLFEKANDSLKKLGRFDFSIMDYKKVDKGVKLAIAFNLRMGKPTKSEVQAFFAEKLEGLSPVCETALTKDDCLTVFASYKENIRPIQESKKMIPVVAGLNFLDSDMGSVWEVTQENNQQVLKQIHKFDIGEYVKERMKRMSQVKAQYQVTATMPDTLMAGDKVKYYFDNAQHDGVISKIKEDEVTLKKPDATEIVLSKDNIFKVTEPAKNKEKLTKESEQKYWQEVLGPKFSNDLVYTK